MDLYYRKIIAWILSKTLEAVSYTHLDVYKRQIFCGAAEGHEQLAAPLAGADGLMPVSYTHLDVYKRQIQLSPDRILYHPYELISSFIRPKNFAKMRYPNSSHSAISSVSGGTVYLLGFICNAVN